MKAEVLVIKAVSRIAFLRVKPHEDRLPRSRFRRWSIHWLTD